MTSQRPLVLGYLREQYLMTEAELADARQHLASFAKVEGFTLGTIFVEHIDREPAAFDALVVAVGQYEATAVVVPSLRHLSALGSIGVTKDRLERHAGARVLIVWSDP